jgi:hypothetical protein
LQLQEVVDATIKVIPMLPFTPDAFADVNPEVVELVLRDVPLQATELEVWRAVKQWCDDFFDLHDPAFGSPRSSETDDAPQVVPEGLKPILQFIDLDCISWKEVQEVCTHFYMQALNLGELMLLQNAIFCSWK